MIAHGARHSGGAELTAPAAAQAPAARQAAPHSAAPHHRGHGFGDKLRAAPAWRLGEPSRGEGLKLVQSGEWEFTPGWDGQSRLRELWPPVQGHTEGLAMVPLALNSVP